MHATQKKWHRYNVARKNPGSHATIPPCHQFFWSVRNGPHALQVHVVTPASCSDQQTNIKVTKALAFAKLLLGDIDEASNTFVLAELSPSFVSLVETGVGSTSTSGQQDFQLHVGGHAKTRHGNTQSVIEHKTDLPVGIINASYIAALVNGHWGKLMMHEQGAVVGQSLTIFLLLQVVASSAGYKHALNDASVVYSEQLVGEHSSNSTKIDTNLFSSGQQKMYDDCLAAIINLHACLTFMLKEGTSSYVIKHLVVLFMTLADYKFKSWFNYHASNDVTWLCHSVLIDIHNYYHTMVSMAMHPDNQSKALKNETITVSAAI
jgi:hypothetical protein